MIQYIRDSIHYWRVEVSLFASGIGLGCVGKLDLAEFDEPFGALSVPAVVVLSAAALGGLFGRMAFGAVCRVVLYCAFAIWTFWSSGFL